jgi:pSer/pThr/pTyr-binding forkhead associated (FHA) protein
MITCPVCRGQEIDGELFCSNCGARLAPANWTEQVPTATFVDTARVRTAALPRPTDALSKLQVGQIALTISDVADAVILEGRTEYILGREGNEEVTPDVDLNPFGGREKGVSRVHAALRRDQKSLMLIDLGSTNGTRLNGRVVAAHQAARVENGDEIRLGKLLMTINFMT